MASVDEDFPRGGTRKKAAESKVKPARVEHTEADNLFQTHEPAEPKKRKGGKSDEGKTGVKKQKKSQEETLKLNATPSVDILHLKNVKVGALLLGCVKEVTDLGVVVGLPSGLVGYLAVSNISDAYTQLLGAQLDSEDAEEVFSLPDSLFSPGMLLRCAVARLDACKGGTVSIQLSVNPKEVNKGLSSGALRAGMVLSGCVESVEDHGYLVDVGVSGTKAFLPKQAATDKSSPKELAVGQCLTALLEEVKNEGRVVRLSVSPAAVGQACADAQHGWTLVNLLPGLSVKAKIKKVTAHGLIVEFLSCFSGLVDFLHMEPGAGYQEGDEVKACVLYIEPSSRLVGLSLRRHLLQPGGATLERASSERVGEVLQSCVMTSLHHMSGATLELPDKTLAFAHRNHMKEPKEPFNMNKVMVKLEHTCRVIEFSPIEQMPLVTLRKSMIEATLFRYHDLKPGQVVTGTVASLTLLGMTVRLTDYITGWVPRLHLSDISLKNPEKKFIVGMRVKCRVLVVEPQQKKLTLTRKKALVESVLPPFLSFGDARPGRVSHGVVVCIKDFGCIVSFYGDVSGLVPVGELSAEPAIFPQSMFYVGQVVKAKVLTFDPERKKLLLSFKDVANEAAEPPTNQQFDFDIGKKVEARVLGKIPGGLKVSIVPEECPALLPVWHLSDHVTNCPLLWEALQEGDAISNLVCLSKSKQDITLTKKPALRCALEQGQVTRDFSDLQIGMQLVGWVKKIMPYGVFVEFPSGLVGLAPKASMSDQFLSDTTGPFEVGQTVGAKVINLDQDKLRFVVSLKASEVATPGGDAHARLAQGLLERRAVADMMANRDDSQVHQQLSVLTVGQKVKLTVDEVREDESVSLKSDELKGAAVLASKQHRVGVEVTPGQKVNAVVLHVDPLTSKVHVSLLAKLVIKKKSLEEGSVYTATVQHADRDFAVVSLGDTAQLTVVQTAGHLNDSFRSASERPTPGRTLTVTVTTASCEDLDGLPLVAWDRHATPKRQRKTSDVDAAKGTPSTPRTGKYHYGDVVTGTVKTIKPTCALVALAGGATGSVHVSEVQEVVCLGTFPTAYLKIGSEVTARVIGGREATSQRFLPFSHPKFTCSIPELTLLPSKLNTDAILEPFNVKDKLQSFKVGEDVMCFVSKYNPGTKSLEVTTNPALTGTVDLLDMISDPKDAKHPEKLFKLGQAVNAKVVEVSSKPVRFCLSLSGASKLEEGSVTMGTVQNIQPHLGLLVKLPQGAMGTVALVDLADSYKINPLESYKKGQLIRCVVVGKEKSKWQLSLRPSRLSPEKAPAVKDPEVSSVADLKTGQVVRGYVKSVGEQGVFVRLSRCIVGRVQFQQATRYYVTDHGVYTKNIPVNALLTAKILSVDEENGQVDLSLLQEDTGKPDVLPESLGLPLRLVGDAKEKHDAKKKTRKRTASESQQEQEQAEEVTKKKKKKAKKTKPDESNGGVDVFFREEEEEEEERKTKPTAVKVKPAPAGPARLQVSGGFSWDTALSNLKPAPPTAATGGGESSEGEEEEEEEQNKPVKKSRQEVESEKLRAEKALTRREAELMDPALRPQDAGGFERLLLAEPDSSLLWLQYMAFHLQATEIEQARGVAERALKTISFREEQEKLNVWVALLNLENLYGSEESLRKVFERAVQFCQPMPVYQQLADIYAKSGKTTEADKLYKTMVKRFRQEKGAWLSYGSFLLQQGQGDAASAVLQRALKSLTSKENVDVIAKFAQLEFRFGDVEKGKSMLDKVLTSYPKRTDLWSVFIDLMVKHGSQQEVRALFDRVIHLSVAVKRVKFFFKRYLEYERRSGTPQSVQAVKEKALEYVEAKGTAAAS